MADLQFQILSISTIVAMDDRRVILKGCLQWNPVYNKGFKLPLGIKQMDGRLAILRPLLHYFNHIRTMAG